MTTSPGTAGAESWDDAPCGLLTLAADGTLLRANRTFLSWVGRTGEETVGRLRLSELLSVGGRIYWETHLAPLLLVDGRVDEVAVELRTGRTRMPVLMTAVASDAPGEGGVVQVALSSARERSRYERELLAARRDAERNAAHVRALQEVTAALSCAVGVEAVASAVLAATVRSLGATAGSLWLLEPERGLALHSSDGEPRDSVPMPDGEATGRDGGAADADGRVTVPLYGQSVLQGVLSLAHGDKPLDTEVLTAIGQQGGLALDRARLYEQSASVAHELQHSLLAVTPPDDPRFAVRTAYRPGVEMLEVGGDWSDVYLARPGVLAIVVGDVVGRGLGAASAMGQLRSAVRAVTGPGVSPAQLLSRLDSFVEQVEAAAMATLAYAELDLASGHLRYACAGHPPPLLLPADGEPRLLWNGRSTPLGAYTRPQARYDAQLRLSPGDRLVLYTDGLVERRGRAIDEGLDLLAEVAGRLRDVPLDEAVTALTETMLQDEQGRDDVCVLLLSWAGSPFERRVQADVTELPAVRRALGTWLAELGVDDRTSRDIVLAASEAMANAAEHSGAGGSEPVSIEARLEQPHEGQDEVVVSVRDRGRWREPVASHERGRGLLIMRGLVDDVRVESGDEAGTTVVLRRRLSGEAS